MNSLVTAADSADVRRARQAAGQIREFNDSGVIAAALMTTNGPSARADAEWMVRAVNSLPAPDGPTIRMRLLVGATFSMVWRNWLIAGERPIRLVGSGESCLRSRTSRFRREFSSARFATSTSRSALNGFSMKS